MTDNNEDDKGPQPHKRYNELLSTCALYHINDDLGGVDNQKNKHNNSINSKQSTRNVVNILEPIVIVIDQTRVQQVGKQQNYVHKVYHIRNRVNHVSYIENRYFVVVKLVVLVCHEKL